MKIIFALMLLSIPGAFAADKALTQAQFAEGLQKSLPALFCGKDAYFRKCFQLSEAECGTAAKSAVEECVKETKLPATLTQVSDGQKWGQQIGECAGGRFEQAQAAKKADSADCKDPGKWK
jgi:hypothetical protein